MTINIDIDIRRERCGFWIAVFLWVCVAAGTYRWPRRPDAPPGAAAAKSL